MAEQYGLMLQNWEGLDLTGWITLSRLFAHLFNLLKADPIDITSDLTRLLVDAWKVVVITGSSPVTLMTLSDVVKITGRRIVLAERSNPSEISLLARAAREMGYLDEYIIIVLPDSQPTHSFVDFVKSLLEVNDLSCAGEEAMKGLEREIALKHKDRHLSECSDYDLVATDCSFLEYAAEMLNGKPHINGDHWFSKNILALMWSLPQEKGAEILYLIENINETLEGRVQMFTDINNFRDKLREVLHQIGVTSGNERLLSVSENDFPPGFFTWKKFFKGTHELFAG